MRLRELCDDMARLAMRMYDSGELQFAATLADQTKELSDAIRWIPVSERLPEPGDEYLVVCGEVQNVATAFRVRKPDGKELWGYRGASIDNVTHWMPLPDPPSEDR